MCTTHQGSDQCERCRQSGNRSSHAEFHEEARHLKIPACVELSQHRVVGNCLSARPHLLNAVTALENWSWGPFIMAPKLPNPIFVVKQDFSRFLRMWRTCLFWKTGFDLRDA